MMEIFDSVSLSLALMKRFWCIYRFSFVTNTIWGEQAVASEQLLAYNIFSADKTVKICIIFYVFIYIHPDKIFKADLFIWIYQTL